RRSRSASTTSTAPTLTSTRFHSPIPPRADRSDRRVRFFHDGDTGAQDVAERAPGTRADVATVASVPAIPRRRSYGQDHRNHRHGTYRVSDDQEVFGVRHEHPLL